VVDLVAAVAVAGNFRTFQLHFRQMYLYIIVALFVIIIIWGIVAFNRLVTLINSVKDAWAGIDVQLKRRYDLIPNLVEIVKGYAKHEKGIFEEVASLRSKAMQSNSLEDKEAANKALTKSISSIFAVAENYPNLLASGNFKQLQSELKETENIIAAARSYYNATVRDLNTQIESFPYNIIAKIYKFQKQEFFKVTGAEATLQPISF
jgi:LemA protein